MIINEPYEDSPAHKYGLVCGDEILSIDGVSTHGLTSAQCSEKMRGEAGTKVLFKVKKLTTHLICFTIQILIRLLNMTGISVIGNPNLSSKTLKNLKHTTIISFTRK